MKCGQEMYSSNLSQDDHKDSHNSFSLAVDESVAIDKTSNLPAMKTYTQDNRTRKVDRYLILFQSDFHENF